VDHRNSGTSPLRVGMVAHCRCLYCLSVMINPAIGAFIHTSLHFFPRKADTETDLQLEVLPAMHLEKSDSIVVQLPQFNGHSCKSAVESWPSVAHAATWKLETHEISFIMSNRSDAGKKLVFNFRKTKTCIVRIPVDGISNKIEEQREFVISTNGSNGAVLKDPVDLQTQIMYMQPVFALKKSVLSFIPSVAGSETTVKFEFYNVTVVTGRRKLWSSTYPGG
jgi:hypothetical protein